MSKDVFLFYHTHTSSSNQFEQDIRELNIDSHATDYIALTKRLPEGKDAIFVKTEHWKTDPNYFDRLASRLESEGSSLSRHEAHVYFELDGSRVAIINGVEAAVDKQRNHITICGVPLDWNKTYTTLNLKELNELARRVAWIAPAHIGMPFHHYSPTLMESVCELSTSPDINVALGYTTGYFPLYNKLARNELPTRVDVHEYADQYGISLLPELDLHTVVPEGFSGCGVNYGSVINDLQEGCIPVNEILDTDLFEPSSCRKGISVWQFIHNYAPFVPFFDGAVNHERWFHESLPETEWLREIDIEANTVSLPRE